MQKRHMHRNVTFLNAFWCIVVVVEDGLVSIAHQSQPLYVSSLMLHSAAHFYFLFSFISLRIKHAQLGDSSIFFCVPYLGRSYYIGRTIVFVRLLRIKLVKNSFRINRSSRSRL
ncbi:hypothetical protein Tcan_01187, partial [Toxocara canis]